VGDWLGRLRFDPLPVLLSSENKAIQYFARRDLLGEGAGCIEDLWSLPRICRFLHRQHDDGSWRYPGGGRAHLRSQEDYNQLETYRMLGELVEKHGLNRAHPAIGKAAEYLFSRQTSEGDFRGIYGTQYTPNYSAAMMELLIKAGYCEDSRIGRGFTWLLSMRQIDGGWTIPLRTVRTKLCAEVMNGPTAEPDKSKPFSHLATGVVLRAFAAHEKHRRAKEARVAGLLLASRFFKKDTYPDRNTVDFWTKFSYPFWFTDLLSSLDSLSLIGPKPDEPQIKKALDWLAARQQQNGVWRLSLLRTKDRELPMWLSLAVCRVFKRFYG
jgi:hypothetical protein